MASSKKILGYLIGAVAAIVIVLAVVALGGVWFIGAQGPSIAEGQIESRTGFDAQIGAADFSLFGAQMHVRDFVVNNPETFGEDRGFFDLEEFYLDTSLGKAVGAARGGKINLSELNIHLNSVTLVRNEDGKLNALAFSDSFAAGGEPPPEEGEKPAPEYLIEKMRLRIDTITAVDQQTGVRKTWEVNIDETYENVDDAKQVLEPLMAEFKGMGLEFVSQYMVASLASFDTYKNLAGSLADTGGFALRQGGQLVTGFGSQLKNVSANVTETVGKAAESVGEAAKGVTEGVGEAAKGVQEGIRGIFGNDSEDEDSGN